MKVGSKLQDILSGNELKFQVRRIPRKADIIPCIVKAKYGHQNTALMDEIHIVLNGKKCLVKFYNRIQILLTLQFTVMQTFISL